MYNIFLRVAVNDCAAYSEYLFIFLSIKHLIQLYQSDEFRAYDWGSEAENMRHYNQVSYLE